MEKEQAHQIRPMNSPRMIPSPEGLLRPDRATPTLRRALQAQRPVVGLQRSLVARTGFTETTRPRLASGRPIGGAFGELLDLPFVHVGQPIAGWSRWIE